MDESYNYKIGTKCFVRIKQLEETSFADEMFESLIKLSILSQFSFLEISMKY